MNYLHFLWRIPTYFVGLVWFQDTIMQFQYVIANCTFFRGVFDRDGRTAGNSFDQNVADVVHFEFEAQTQGLDGSTGVWISERVVKSCHPYSKPVKAICTAIDSDHRCSGVGFGHSPVSLEHNDFGPDFVINAVPFINDFLDVIL